MIARVIRFPRPRKRPKTDAALRQLSNEAAELWATRRGRRPSPGAPALRVDNTEDEKPK